MALIYDGIECSICGSTLDLKEQYVATSHFISDQNDALWQYSDSAMHYMWALAS
jgi:hypothetical protein